MAIIGRFAVNISYNIGLQYAAELLPTVVRAQGVALIHIMGYVASILAPFVVYLVNSFPKIRHSFVNKVVSFAGKRSSHVAIINFRRLRNSWRCFSSISTGNT